MRMVSSNCSTPRAGDGLSAPHARDSSRYRQMALFSIFIMGWLVTISSGNEITEHIRLPNESSAGSATTSPAVANESHVKTSTDMVFEAQAARAEQVEDDGQHDPSMTSKQRLPGRALRQKLMYRAKRRGNGAERRKLSSCTVDSDCSASLVCQCDAGRRLFGAPASAPSPTCACEPAPSSPAPPPGPPPSPKPPPAPPSPPTVCRHHGPNSYRTSDPWTELLDLPEPLLLLQCCCSRPDVRSRVGAVAPTSQLGGLH